MTTLFSRRATLAAAFLVAASSHGFAQGFGPPSAPQPSVRAIAGTELAPKVQFSVTSLRRMPDKGVLQLEFSVTNGSDLAVSLRDMGMGDWNRLEGVHLVDFTNKRRYAMGRSDGSCLCTNFAGANGGVIKPGDTKTFWAWFAMPPMEVQRMSVLLPERSPILDVQIQ